MLAAHLLAAVLSVAAQEPPYMLRDTKANQDLGGMAVNNQELATKSYDNLCQGLPPSAPCAAGAALTGACYSKGGTWGGTCTAIPAATNTSSFVSSANVCGLVPGVLVSSASGNWAAGQFFPLLPFPPGSLRQNTRYNFGLVAMSTVETTYAATFQYSASGSSITSHDALYDTVELLITGSGVTPNSITHNGATIGNCVPLNYDNANGGNGRVIASSTFTVRLSFDVVSLTSATVTLTSNAVGTYTGQTLAGQFQQEGIWKGAGKGPPVGFAIETLQSGSASDFVCYDSKPDNKAVVHVIQWELCAEGSPHS